MSLNSQSPPPASYTWFMRANFPLGSYMALGSPLELWRMEPGRYESFSALAADQVRRGRPVDEREVVADAVEDLLTDVLNAAGGAEHAHGHFVAAFSAASETYRHTSIPEAEPTGGSYFTDRSLEEAWYSIEELVVWVRTLNERLTRRALKRGNPNQGMIPALADGPLLREVHAAHERFVAGVGGEARFLSNLNLHSQSSRRGSKTAVVSDGDLVLPFPNRVTKPIDHRVQLGWTEHRDAVTFADGLIDGVNGLIDELLTAFERHVPPRVAVTLP